MAVLETASSILNLLAFWGGVVTGQKLCCSLAVNFFLILFGLGVL